MGASEPSTRAPRASVGATSRYEVLPFPRVLDQAAALAGPAHLAVTTSPKHGIDHSLDFAASLRNAGHQVTLHLAARMVRNRDHLHSILARSRDLGIDDLFVIGGDAPEPLGPYAAAIDVLELIGNHSLRPGSLGIGGYPEGHAFIAQGTLDEALAEKAPLADYMVTQLCFAVEPLVAWLESVRARSIDLPLHIGAAGPVSRRRLLDISLKVGVGASVRYLRKQRGITRLLRGPTHAATRFFEQASTLVGRPDLNVVGFHFFTFNELSVTMSWQEDHAR